MTTRPGLKGALVTHGMKAPLVLAGVPQPDVVARDLSSLADAICKRWANNGTAAS